MSSNPICPFCNRYIEGLYEIRETTRQSRGKIKIKRKKIRIGTDYELHKKTCTSYNNFLKETNNELGINQREVPEGI